MTSEHDDAWAPVQGAAAAPTQRSASPDTERLPQHGFSPQPGPTTAPQPSSETAPLPSHQSPSHQPPPQPSPAQQSSLHRPAFPSPMAQPPLGGATHLGAGGPDRNGEALRAGRTRSRAGVPAVVVVLLVLASLLLGAIAGLVGGRFLPGASTGTEAEPTGLPTAGDGGGGAPAGDGSDGSWVGEIAPLVLESTVYIQVRGSLGGSAGSGFVVREDGYIVTNNHVVEPAGDSGQITVVFSDGTEEAAEVVGASPDYDLAVLRIDRNGLAPLLLGDSDRLAIGDQLIAVGAPLGLSGTVTAGIVSAVERPVTVRDPSAEATDPSTYINAIQTDAAINRGNSGGPLVDDAGEVIGVNTAVARDASSGGGGNEPGFAIPSNQVRHTVGQLIEDGVATYPVIGVTLDLEYQGEGVRVRSEAAGDAPAVTPGGPADVAGIAPGDVIVAIDGRPVSEPTELVVRIRSRLPGEVVALTVREDSDERDVEVTLGEQESR